jgi:hypothetical protein
MDFKLLKRCIGLAGAYERIAWMTRREYEAVLALLVMFQLLQAKPGFPFGSLLLRY